MNAIKSESCGGQKREIQFVGGEERDLFINAFSEEIKRMRGGGRKSAAAGNGLMVEIDE